MKRAIAIAGALLLWTAPAAWAESTDVTGALAMPSGKAIKGYPVVISGTYASGATHHWVTTTDESGKFKFDNLPAGQYVVSPGNDPDAAKSFELESSNAWWDVFKTKSEATDKDVGTIQVDPGSKLRAPAD